MNGNIRILIIEDEPSVSRMMARLLARAGCEVETSADAERGLKMACNGHFEVITLDIDLPGMNGIETCCLLKNDPGLSEYCRGVCFRTCRQRGFATRFRGWGCGLHNQALSIRGFRSSRHFTCEAWTHQDQEFGATSGNCMIGEATVIIRLWQCEPTGGGKIIISNSLRHCGSKLSSESRLMFKAKIINTLRFS